MRKYIWLMRNGFLASIAYRFHYFFSFFTNIFYIFIIYFLWKAIYAGSGGTLHNLTFNQAFIYLALASSVFVLFNTFTEWRMSSDIITGNIAHDLIKPFNYQIKWFFNSLGLLFFTLFTITLPTIIVLILFFNLTITSVQSIGFFIVSLFFAFCISFLFDFIIGCFSFYTHSIWGISITKEIIVLLLSGATIPVQFYPGIFKKIIQFLPFQAIYNIPLSILIIKDFHLTEYMKDIALQLGWLLLFVLISYLFFKRAVKKITIHGG